MDLVVMDLAEKRKKMKLTVLHRAGGKWHASEESKLANGLTPEVQSHPQYPEYLILVGHHTKEATLAAIGGGMAYTATQVVGASHEDLPWPYKF